MGYNLRLHVPGQPRKHCSNVLKCWRNINDCVIYILLPATCQLIAKNPLQRELNWRSLTKCSAWTVIELSLTWMCCLSVCFPLLLSDLTWKCPGEPRERFLHRELLLSQIESVEGCRPPPAEPGWGTGSSTSGPRGSGLWQWILGLALELEEEEEPFPSWLALAVTVTATE